MRDSIPSSPGDGGAATLAADSSTDSVTELIDLEASDTAETPFAAAASSPLLTTQKNSTSKDPSPSTPGQRTSPRVWAPRPFLQKSRHSPTPAPASDRQRAA